MKKSAFIAACVVSLSASSAFAGDGWSGFYVGLETGVARNVVTVTDDFPPLGAYDETGASTGVLAGVFAGYDQQFGDFVIGGVADMDYVGTHDIVFQGKSDTNYDMNWAATARVRAGFAPSDKVLLFGTGGIAFAGVSGNLGGASGPNPIKSTETGYVIGLGAEYRFDNNWSVKGEYLHYDFGKIEAVGSTANFKPRLDAFKIGVAYRF